MSKVFNGKIVIESITTRASKVLATGDISATEADNVTYTLYEDGLLKISGTGATKDYDDGSVFEDVFAQYFENQCTEAGLDCSDLNVASPLQMYEIYANYDTAIEYMIASGQLTQDQITQMGVTTDVELLEAMSGTDLDDDNLNKCVELLKTSAINITDLKIETGITSIGKRDFVIQDYITLIDLSGVDLRLPSTISSLSEYAFCRTEFNSITLNKGLTTISSYALTDAGGITNFPDTIDLANSNDFYGYEFSNVVDLSSYSKIPDNQFVNTKLNGGIILGENLKEIGVSAFAGSNLSGELVIPNSVEIIERQAFSNTQITSLKLPENDVYHGFDGAQNGSAGICNACMNLKTVEIPLNVYNLVIVGQDLIWGGASSAPEGAKYIMPIKASEYGENYRIYSYDSTNGYVDLGPVTTFEGNKAVTLEWQPE